MFQQFVIDQIKYKKLFKRKCEKKHFSLLKYIDYPGRGFKTLKQHLHLGVNPKRKKNLNKYRRIFLICTLLKKHGQLYQKPFKRTLNAQTSSPKHLRIFVCYCLIVEITYTVIYNRKVSFTDFHSIPYFQDKTRLLEKYCRCLHMTIILILMGYPPDFSEKQSL